jgi:outer membrane protein OmpA-like peptidoglycan-associated protein
MQIATWTGANQYAADTLNKAQVLLGNAEAFNARKVNKKDVITLARQVVQTAEDARIIAIRKQDEEHLAKERQAAAEREAQAKAAAAAAAEQQRIEAERRAAAETQRREAEAARAQAEAQQLQADARRVQAETERQAAERAKAEALVAAQQAADMRAAADKARADAEAARQAALLEQQKAQAEADRARQQAADADRLRQQAEADRDNLRQQLREQLNAVLETRETARGLIVNMSDVLFDTGKYTLKPGAREKLARVAGIVAAHPGLTLEVEGHTDNVGGDEYNQRLSEQRAAAVRDYLTGQGVNPSTVSARGFGKTQPVAANDTAAGRQRNRRVELVVSGDVIGRQLRGTVSSIPPQAPPPQVLQPPRPPQP